MKDKNIYVTKPLMPEFDEFVEAIRPLWGSRWLTNMGKYHKELEQNLAEYLGVPEISLMTNGHLALELLIQAFGFEQGSEVITTPFTFISTTHSIVRNGLKPVFCDVKEDDGTVDETKIEELITPKTVAILPVHVYGNICNVQEIQRIADKHGLKVIYDAAHAFGEKSNGVAVGNFGDASMFSFHATKVYNTVEGGAVVCKKHWLYEKLYNLKNFGIRGEECVTEVGANAKMNEMMAIMGLCNLKHIDEAISKRKRISEAYKEFLEKLDGVKIIGDICCDERNYGYFPIRIERNDGIDRNEVYRKLKENGIIARKYFYPITSAQECYVGLLEGIETPVARKMSEQCLTLPIYPDMTKEEFERIRFAIEKIFCSKC